MSPRCKEMWGGKRMSYRRKSVIGARSTRRMSRRKTRSARRTIRRSRRKTRSARRTIRRSRRKSRSARRMSRRKSRSARRMSRRKSRSARRMSRRKSKDGRRTGSRSRVRIPVKHPGALEGYHYDDPLKVKRKILEWYVDKDGYSTVIKRLNVLAIYNKNRNPKMSDKIKRDIGYLQKKY